MSGLDWVLHQQEGQFFERKSCYDRSKGTVKLRPVRAMLNGLGGSTVIGVNERRESK